MNAKAQARQYVLNNPFKKAKRSSYGLGKRSVAKYSLLACSVVSLVVCLIIISLKALSIRVLIKETEGYEQKLRNVKMKIGKIDEDMQLEEKAIAKNEAIRVELNDQQKELSRKRRELKKNNATAENEMNFRSLKNQIQLETMQYDRQREENCDLEMRKSELENKVNEYKRELVSLKEEYTLLHSKLDAEADALNEREVLSSSDIITSLYYQTLRSWFSHKKPFRMRLIYKREGLSPPEDFHSKVNSHNNTFVVVTSGKDVVIGGYTTQSWSGIGYKEDSEAFLFDLVKGKQFFISMPRLAIHCSLSSFPSFGVDDLTIRTDSIITKFPKSYAKDNPIELELTTGREKLKLDNLEVFSLR